MNNTLIDSVPILKENNPHLNNYNFSANPIGTLIPLFRKILNDEQVEIAPLIFQYYALIHLISESNQNDNITVLQKNSLLIDYFEILENMSQKIFSYIFVNSFIESFFCAEFSNATSKFLSTQIINYDVFNTEISYKQFIKLIKNEEGQKIIQENINKFVPAHLNNSANQKELTTLFQEILFNNQNIYSMTVSEMADEILSGYSIANFKNLSIENFCEIIQNIFILGSFENNYGGNKWSFILNHLQKFSNGTINSEIFIDQAFSLEHNNGTIFSKHNIFKSSENYNILLQSKEKKSFNERYINFNQLILNAQHQKNVFIATENKYQNIHSKLQTTNPELSENINQLIILQNFLKERCENFLTKYKEIIPESNNLDLTSFFDTKSSWFSYFNSLSLPKSNSPFTFNVSDLEKIDFSNINKERVGNKAFGISELHKLNIKTPKGFVFDTLSCLSYLQKPEKFIQIFNQEFKSLSHIFGNFENPFLVSVRSGAPVSMPGMMDTILNVGIDDSNYQELCDKYGIEVIKKCSLDFMESFLKSYNIHLSLNFEKSLEYNLETFREQVKLLNIKDSPKSVFPLNKQTQLQICIEKVFSSWNSDRATQWRNENNISHNLGTACIIQQMVLGNLNNNSLTGVIFSSDCITGQDNIIGEYLINEQGESIVGGEKTPLSLEQLKIDFPKIYHELHYISKLLENKHNEIKDIEFTVENGELFILQQRKAVLSPQAKIKLYENKSPFVTLKEVQSIQETDFVSTNAKPFLCGKPAQAGVLHGIIIHHEDDKIKYQHIYENNFQQNSSNFGWILSTEKANPEHLNILLKSDGFITKTGGNTCHAAIIARSLNKPCIVGVGTHNLQPGDIVTIDATNGIIWNSIQPIEKKTLSTKYTYNKSLYPNSWIEDLSIMKKVKNNNLVI